LEILVSPWEMVWLGINLDCNMISKITIQMWLYYSNKTAILTYNKDILIAILTTITIGLLTVAMLFNPTTTTTWSIWLQITTSLILKQVYKCNNNSNSNNSSNNNFYHKSYYNSSNSNNFRMAECNYIDIKHSKVNQKKINVFMCFW